MNAINVAHALLRAASRLIATPEASRNAPNLETHLDGARKNPEEDTLAMLRESHREPIAEAHYAAVRARVLSTIGPSGIGLPACPRAEGVSRTWRILIPSFAMAAAALLLAFWPKHEVHPQPAPRPLLAVSAHPAAPPVKAPRIAHAAPPRRHRPSQPVTGVIGPPNPQPLVVKLVTNDPDIVIYWISEKTGE